MGEWFRLKASVNPASFDPAVRPIIVALQHYGAIIADNGSAWYITGAPDSRWNNDKLATLGRIKGSDFEAVDTHSMIVNPNSGQATTASSIATAFRLTRSAGVRRGCASRKRG